MKKADKQTIVIIQGDNNKVSFGGTCSQLSAIVVTLVLIALAVLIVSLCCPKELLADFVRWMIGKAANS